LSTDKRIRSLVRTVRKHQEWLANNTFEIQALESTSSANPDPRFFPDTVPGTCEDAPPSHR
jgi:hypothetical protein